MICWMIWLSVMEHYHLKKHYITTTIMISLKNMLNAEVTADSLLAHSFLKTDKQKHLYIYAHLFSLLSCNQSSKHCPLCLTSSLFCGFMNNLFIYLFEIQANDTFTDSTYSRCVLTFSNNLRRSENGLCQQNNFPCCQVYLFLFNLFINYI